MSRHQWTEDAACVGVDPDIWFPEIGQSPHPAKMICYGCPVRMQCLDDVLSYEQRDWLRHGIYGGLNPDQRSALARGDRSVLAVPEFPCGHPRTMRNAVLVGSTWRCRCWKEAAA